MDTINIFNGLKGIHNTYGNYSTPEKGSTAAAGPRPGYYQDQNVWNTERYDAQFQQVTNQSTANTETISAFNGSHTYKSSSPDFMSETKSSESKPTKYIITAAGLQPLEDNNATIARLDERKPPASSNRLTTTAMTESSLLKDDSSNKERTNSMSEVYELLTDNDPTNYMFSEHGVEQEAQDNNVTIAQLDERKLPANRSC